MAHLLVTRKGWQNEHLGLFILSKLAFCANPVTVSDDLGSDFFCCLFSLRKYRNQDTVVPQSSFAIQIKSSSDTFDVSNKVEYLRDLEIPYLVGVVDNDQLTLTLYSGEFLPLFFGLRGTPERLRFKLVNRRVSIERFNERYRANRYRILLPRVAEIRADSKVSDLQTTVTRLQALCERIQGNIATRRTQEHIYSLDRIDRPHYILAGAGSAKVFRENVYKRVAEAYFNFRWIIENRPQDYDPNEVALYDEFFRQLKKQKRPLPKLLTRIHHRFHKYLQDHGN